jgi:hypothetical protein
VRQFAIAGSVLLRGGGGGGGRDKGLSRVPVGDETDARVFAISSARGHSCAGAFRVPARFA